MRQRGESTLSLTEVRANTQLMMKQNLRRLCTTEPEIKNDTDKFNKGVWSLLVWLRQRRLTATTVMTKRNVRNFYATTVETRDEIEKSNKNSCESSRANEVGTREERYVWKSLCHRRRDKIRNPFTAVKRNL